jgi:putative nucleotidyltransferase with HDIG domain
MFKNQASMVIQRALIYDELRKQYLGTIQALVNVIEAKDKYTEGHSRRVSRFAVEMAKEMGYSNEEIENIEIAGLLHDVGKIGIDQEILIKQGMLTEEEFLAMKEHPTKGIQILDSIGLEEPIKEGILYHHLRYDLKGYPKAAIDELPKYAGIIGIADAFDAITSARSYSKAKTIEEALNELVRHEGTQFHPEMVSVMKRIIEEAPNRIQVIIDDTII